VTENEELALEVEELNTALELALRQRDELQAERDDDVRAVAEACADFGNDEGPRGIRQLYAQFEDRITELERRDAARAAAEPIKES
jgi:hypothetical protein